MALTGEGVALLTILAQARDLIDNKPTHDLLLSLLEDQPKRIQLIGHAILGLPKKGITAKIRKIAKHFNDWADAVKKQVLARDGKID